MQVLGQSSVTSRCSPQHCGQMRPCTAGQNRFSFRFSQIAQLTNRWLLKSLSHAKSIVWLGLTSIPKNGPKLLSRAVRQATTAKRGYLWAFEVPQMKKTAYNAAETLFFHRKHGITCSHRRKIQRST